MLDNLRQILKSKTILFGLTLAVSSLSPFIDSFVKDNSPLVLRVIAAIVIALRAITNSGLIK